MWGRVDPVATVTQMVGVDASGLIQMIAQRAETVRRNRYECRQQAETILDLLEQVQRKHPAVDGLVGKLEATLREALVLVSTCQGSSYFRRFVRSGKQAQQFSRIKHKIDFYLQLFPVIGHIDTTRRLNILLDSVESPQTQQNMMPRSTSSRSGPPASRSTGNEDLMRIPSLLQCVGITMQGMKKSLPELLSMLKTAEVEIRKEHQVLMINKTTGFKKDKKGKQKGKKGGKTVAAPEKKPRDGPKSDTECYYCKGTGHWKRNCPKYLADKKAGKANKGATEQATTSKG